MKFINIILSILSVICLSCSGDEEETGISAKTVIIYMAADNNLYKNAQADIQEMLECEIPASCNLAVYVDAPLWVDMETPRLFKIQSGELIPVKQYGSHNSASGDVVRQVIFDAMNNCRAKTYDLVLWSHGTGWLPSNIFNNLTKSFGKEDGFEIEITDLANTLPDGFECIIFDACLMGCIEVFYQLRNKADVIIASPTETLVAGFPYGEIIPLLFASSPDYTEIARKYMLYYENQTGVLQSATVSVIDTEHLKSLASLLYSTVAAGNTGAVHDKNNMQKYDLLNNSIFYDFMDCIRNAVYSENRIAEIERQISKTVIYNGFTPYFLNKLEIINSCGISIYVSSGDRQLDEAYKQLEWYIDTHFIID
ncbi:MAG: hypothetical protein LBQ22_07660 [Bacteroidales bacterium]|jgi:hypothetical protein|nr:hypothetical protein [Bacteroidales bacterium]